MNMEDKTDEEKAERLKELHKTKNRMGVPNMSWLIMFDEEYNELVKYFQAMPNEESKKFGF